MNQPCLAFLFVTCACALLPACAGPGGGSAAFDPWDTGVPFEPQDGPDVKNGTDPDFLFRPDILEMIYDLQNHALDGGTGEIPETATIADAPPEARHRVLANIVNCALGDTDVVYDPIDATPYHGHVGLATSWLESPLESLSDQRFVSACVVQHLNGLGLEVDILLEGDTPALLPDAMLRERFAVTDAGIWGNLFLPVPEIFACAMPGVVEECSEPEWVEGINKRICDSSPACNLDLVGYCTANCVEDSTTGLWSCPPWEYTEVVTSRTQREDGLYLCVE